MRTIHYFILTLLSYCSTNYVVAQQSNGFTSSKISFSQIQDSVIKREVATFTYSGSSIQQYTKSNTQLTEIPINICSESVVHFFKKSTSISLHFKQNHQNKTLDSIFLVIKNHVWVRIPTHTLVGIDHLYPCPSIPNNKHKKIYAPYYKAFQSKDKLRYYIYLQGGSDSNRYEATWIINSSRYVAFVADYIPLH